MISLTCQKLYYCCFLISGLGLGFVSTNCIVILSYYFHKKLALAYGIGLSGGSIGMLFFAPLIRYLTDAFSWRGAMFLCGAILANTCVFTALFRITRAEVRSMTGIQVGRSSKERPDEHNRDIHFIGNANNIDDNPRPPKPKIVHSVRRHLYTTFVKSYAKILSIRVTMICVLSPLLYGFGYYTATMFFVSNAINLGIPKTDSAFLLSICGICGTLGRLFFGPLIDEDIITVFHLASLLLFIAGSSCFIGTLAKSYIALILFAIVFGCSASPANSMCSLMIREVVGVNYFKKIYGTSVLLMHAACLIALPLMGKFKSPTRKSYLHKMKLLQHKTGYLKVPDPISQNKNFYSNDASSPKKSWFQISVQSVKPF